MHNEELLHRLMSGYAEREGAGLRQELGSQTKLLPTPGLDKKVRRGLFKIKYKVHVRAAGVVAACLALALLLPVILQQPGPGMLAPQPQMAVPAPVAPAAGALPEAEADLGDIARRGVEPEAFIFYDAEFYEIFEERPDYLPLPPEGEYTLPFAVGGFAGELECPVYGDNIVPEVGGYGFVDMPPLSFELPEGFYRVEGFVLDGYYFYRFAHWDYPSLCADFLMRPLRSQYDTPVIMNEGRRPIELGGQTVYYLRFPGNHYGGTVIFFERDYIYHVLTSRFDWETTLLLAEALFAEHR